MSEITPAKAKKIIADYMTLLDLKCERLTAKTIHFSDLARSSRVFVTIHGWKPDPAAQLLKDRGNTHGFIVRFEQ